MTSTEPKNRQPQRKFLRQQVKQLKNDESSDSLIELDLTIEKRKDEDSDDLIELDIVGSKLRTFSVALYFCKLILLFKFSKFDTRKALKPLIKDEKLNQDTLIAVQAEKERKKRIEERKKKV